MRLSNKLEVISKLLNNKLEVMSNNGRLLLSPKAGVVSIIAAFFLIAGLSACRPVHQFPEPKDPTEQPDDPNNPNNPDNPDDPDEPVLPPDYPDDPDLKVSIPLRLKYYPDFYLWEHNYDPVIGKIEEANPGLEIYPGHPGVSDKYSNIQESGFIETHVKVYLTTYRSYFVEDYTYLEEIKGDYDRDMTIDLYPEFSYEIGFWSHLRFDEFSNPFYDFSDFNRVSIINDNYAANTDYRDGFSGSINIITEKEYYEPIEIPMTRPMGKFELVTTDLSEFLDRETTRRNLPNRARADDYRVIFSFPMYYPSSYSLMDDRLENSSTGVRFETQMVVTGESEASLGFEYVMLNDNDDAAVQAKVDIYDTEGTHVAGSATLTIPMKRDHHTLLRGAFLRELGEGGIGIDPSFNGDHNVIW